MNTTYTHFCLFAGIGGLSMGLSRGHARIGQSEASLRCLGGIDSDPQAMRDFERLTGAKGTVLDLFDGDDYQAFHGHAPPSDWREATPDDMRKAAGGESPDILCMSPPCKGFSKILNAKRAGMAKYTALNNLLLRGLVLSMEAWADDPPSLILVENVPRIQRRGRELLDVVADILVAYGYAVQETTHDCGELGGLAQRRKRFLMVARHRMKVPPFLYEPPTRPCRTIGEVFEQLPSPGAGGPMHQLPRCTFQTWLRLALIPGGKDWRALQELTVVDGRLAEYRLDVLDWGDYHAYGVKRWDQTSETVTGRAQQGAGAFSIADPRVPWNRDWRGKGPYAVAKWDKASGCVVGAASHDNGAWSIADPRLDCDVGDKQKRRHNNVYKVTHWEDAGAAVTGSATGNTRPNCADPRLPAKGERCTPLIISVDGTWHRPMTTLELAALQGFPTDGLVLDGKSQSRWRMAVGNAVPPPAAQAIGAVMANTLLARDLGSPRMLHDTPIWVRPLVTALSVDA